GTDISTDITPPYCIRFQKLDIGNILQRTGYSHIFRTGFRISDNTILLFKLDIIQRADRNLPLCLFGEIKKKRIGTNGDNLVVHRKLPIYISKLICENDVVAGFEAA